MKRYIALLRGVNISGKNRLPMPELKARLEASGYKDVLTHLNSGNAVFSTDELPDAVLSDSISEMIRQSFGLDIPVFVILQEKLTELLKGAPAWWGTSDKAIYDNLIFVLPPFTAELAAEKIGAPTAGLERILIHKNAVFWSFDRQKYAQANWWKKTASAGIGEMLTIRTANTLRKLAVM